MWKKKTKVERILRQPSPVLSTIDQKQPENVKYFKYLGSMITNDARCTCEIKSKIAMAKDAFNKKKTLFTSKPYLNLKKKLVKFKESATYGQQLCMVLKIKTLQKTDHKYLKSFEVWY